MIKVKVKKEDNKISSVYITGHAKYDEYGKDIVCAAVSSIATTTVNAIIKIDEDCIAFIQSDDLTINVKKHTEVTDLLIQNMMDLLKELEDQYPKNIKIEI